MSLKEGDKLFKLRYKEKINEAVTAKCPRHPRFDPEQDGRAGLKDRCSTCYELLALHQSRLDLDLAIREFRRRAAPWQNTRTQINKSDLKRNGAVED